jgi:hypothetical protein
MSGSVTAHTKITPTKARYRFVSSGASRRGEDLPSRPRARVMPQSAAAPRLESEATAMAKKKKHNFAFARTVFLMRAMISVTARRFYEGESGSETGRWKQVSTSF